MYSETRFHAKKGLRFGRAGFSCLVFAGNRDL